MPSQSELLSKPEGFADDSEEIRARLRASLDQLDHVLPGQAPILNFVHHNTLHGYQHLPFASAVKAAGELTGIHGYLPLTDFRRYYAQGRINDDDLRVAYARIFDAHGFEPIRIGSHSIDRFEFYRIVLLFGIDAITPSQFNWQLEEMGMLQRFQADVPLDRQAALLHGYASEAEAIQSLWNVCLDVFGLSHYRMHPEELIHIPLQIAVDIVVEFDTYANDSHACAINPRIHHQMRTEAALDLGAMVDSVGKGMTLRGLLLKLTGMDLLDQVRPVLIRFCASHLDEGLAAWRSPDRHEGLYVAWKRCAMADFSMALSGLPDWRGALGRLPDQSVDAIVHLLESMGIPQSNCEDSLECLAMELPGWAGIINWRVRHPDYKANRECPASLMDFLAIRLFLDALWVERISRETWGQPGHLIALKTYFERHPSEFLTRRMLYAGELPEFLANVAQKLIGLGGSERSHHEDWRALADMIWNWKQAATADSHTVYRSPWRLFRLCQHLGLGGKSLQGVSTAESEGLLSLLDALTPGEMGQLWLEAYENHYRDELFTALWQNHPSRSNAGANWRADAQVIFCMDDREESLRRHLEEQNPDIETFGAAGFFGIPMNWLGLDAAEPVPLCPVVVQPSHEIREQAQPGQAALAATHERRRQRLSIGKRWANQEVRRNLFISNALIYLLAPGSLALLVGKLFFPRQVEAWLRKAGQAFIPTVATQLPLTATADGSAATPENPRLGFTEIEQAERVGSFLRNIGLTANFAPLVVLMGHGSHSQNNPHLAAYDCGACSGRHGGPNARAFAVMANRPEVRKRLAGQGIAIPQDTWFLGMEHDTCDEAVTWYDLDAMPRHFAPALEALRTNLDQALLLSAHERCRRFASAPPNPSLQQALRHVVGRAADFSQARPELGHATNAAALVGRRAVTRGAFLDRRVFLISYDPTQDAEGFILEGILLAVGPVGAGINLEYYFSTVNNDRFGCGSKVPHNVAGLFGVMEGTSSDLRTGLPRQMIEIHEAMRLQVVVEATEDQLIRIYQRQPPLRELIGNGWILLSAIHPDTGVISSFDPHRGFTAWVGPSKSLPVVANSRDWYDGHAEPMPPALIRRGNAQEFERHAA